ncbi:J domain-containing protein [Erythrobacter sp. SCSIO 43205]|uniref:J domain-containing protein n=1 Tax=Erythrobacter sp. SCSIO 43205 TaxID=2779361 RepID=UPI001CA94C48|nr:J domain-containing protein [Erythrobacter sp. SCSIO 43205]UAB76938.1 J domain-containing protein [Erythrobacter sp. SCSIO 43205]
MSEEAYPLQWPQGEPRTQRPERARFDVSFATARDHLMEQLRIMGARYPVLSSNLTLRRDGLPYANQPEPDDKGVAVYFQWKGKQMTFACDRWDRTRDNVRSIGKTIEAIRGIERWGASNMMERAFSAFEALPVPEQSVTLSCWDVLGIEPTTDQAAIKSAWRNRMKTAHPDQGGTTEEFAAVQKAYDEASIAA